MKNIFTFDFASVGGSSIYDNDKNLNYKEITKFGKVVYWLDGRHYDSNELEKYRKVGDFEIDNLLELIICHHFQNKEHDVTTLPSFRFFDVIDACTKVYRASQGNDLTCRVKRNDMEKAMINFYDHYYNDIPDWVDWDQLQRGIDVFITYTPVMGLSLYYLSLVPGFSIPKIAQVLKHTQYLAPPSTNKQVQRRLLDTGGFIMSCMVKNIPENDNSKYVDNDRWLSAASLRPGGIGWQMALRVRVLHAKVRRNLLSRDDWNKEKFGIPINQEDMAATLLAFSVNALSGVEFAANQSLSKEDQLDYLALWRYIGWLLGVSLHIDPCGPGQNNNIFPSDPVIHSRAMLESIIIHLMHPDELSSIISNHLLRVGRSEANPNTDSTTYHKNESFGYLYRSFMCRTMIGNELANALTIPSLSVHSFRHIRAYLLAKTVMLAFRVYTLLTMYIPWFRYFVYKLHMRMIDKSFSSWSKENGTRISKMSRDAMTKNENDSYSKSCPFSYVMLSSGQNGGDITIAKKKQM